MAFTLDEKSLDKLHKVHRDLAAVILHAAELADYPFIVTEGLRTVERQRMLVKAGASQTMNSNHLTGYAVDLAVVIDGEVNYSWPLYDILARIVKIAAHDLGISIKWGGDWVNFKDGPHFELDRSIYIT